MLNSKFTATFYKKVFGDESTFFGMTMDISTVGGSTSWKPDSHVGRSNCASGTKWHKIIVRVFKRENKIKSFFAFSLYVES